MRKSLLHIFAAVFVLALASGTVLGHDVLVWSTGNGGGNTQGVADYIDANGVFSSVSVSQNPNLTLAELLNYDGVLFFTNSGEGDMVYIGNTLADYADTGRRLVLATFCWANQGNNTLAGRIIDEEISPFRYETSSLYTNVTMDWNDGSEFFDGVNAVSGFYHDDVYLVTGAEERATWSDGEPMVGTKGNVVAVNLFPDDFWGNIGGDYAPLFANCLSYGLTATEEAGWSTLKALY